MRKVHRVKQLLTILVFLIVFNIYGITVQAEEYDGGPIKVIYDFIGHYSLNYSGNTNHYDYWNAGGTSKLVNRNYKDRVDIPSNNNSVATISKTDSQSAIKYAVLIWQSRSESAPTASIGIVSPTGKAKTYTADWVCQDTRVNANGEEYVGVYTMVAEVTDLVCSTQGGYGTYTVANIPVWDGVQAGEVVCGGESVASWQLVVVEESPNFPLRTISLNTLSQYFFNINYTVNVNFADASSPTGDISLQWYDLFVDVDSQYRLSGAISTDPSHWYDSSNYRYRTPTRGLYKNGVSFNSRDTGDVYKTGSAASGAIHGHLYDDIKNWNSLGTTGIIYLQEGTNRGICVSTLGVAIDVFAYDIVFEGNGADSGSMDNLTCIYGRGYNLTENQYVKPYWKFVGWNTKPDGSGVAYKNGQYIRNLTSTEDKIVLYAQWEPDPYMITLDNQYAVTSGTKAYYEWYGIGNYTTAKCVDEISSITVPTKRGFKFNGYYIEKNGQGTKYIDSDGKILSTPTTFDSDTTLYAYWTSGIYKITLDNQGADTTGTREYYEKFDVGNYTTADCTTEITQIELPTKKHHEFGGYYTEKNGEGQQIIDKDGKIISATYTTFDKDTTIYAYWKPNTYIISLDSQDATNIGTQAYYEKYGLYNYVKLVIVDSESNEIIKQFDYTGSEQVFVAPYTGVYKLDIVGASGKSTDAYSNISMGGRVLGEIELNEGDVLYIYVGGQGEGKNGGWNGGGDGYFFNVGGGINPAIGEGLEILGGGGATDVRVGGRTLYDRIAVAGGGAGTMYKVKSGLNPKTYGGRSIALFHSDFSIPGHSGVIDVEGANQFNSGNFNVGDEIYYHNTEYTSVKVTVKEINKGSFGYGVTGGGGGWYGGGSLLGYATYTSTVGSGSFHVTFGASSGSSYIDGLLNPDSLYVGKGYSPTGIYRYVSELTGTGVLDENGEYLTTSGGDGFAIIRYDDYRDKEVATTSITIPKKEGYSFGGYYTEKDGQGTQYVDESGNILSTPTTFEEDTTLYAYWIADASTGYKIAFNGNGANAGMMPLMTCEFDRTYMLTENAFTKTGYTFAGWSTTADGAVVYADKASVKNLATHSGEVVTLYAQWTPSNVAYKVRHYTESLTGDWELHSTDIKSGLTGTEITLSAFKKSISGFTYKNAKVKGLVADKTVIFADGSLVIDLYYTRNSYTVTLEKDGGVASVSGVGTYKFDEIVNIDADVLPNYEWINWNGTLSSAKKEYEFNMPASNVTMKANTKASVYTIYLDNQKANESGTLQYYEKYNTGNFADSGCNTSITNITLPKRTGYIFGGYYTETNGNGTQYVKADGTIISTKTTFTEDTVLYAKWTPITYKIHFEGNGSTGGSMSDMVCTYDTQYQLNVNQFIKNKYRFIGWNTKEDGTGHSYIDKSYIENLCEEQDGVITLYAQWTPNTYIVHFDANSGSGTMEDMECEFNVDYVLNENQFTKVGYDFAGWSLIPDGDVVLSDKAVINNLHSTTGIVTLYAQWTPGIVTYKVNHYTESLDASWMLHSTDDLTGYTEDVLVLADLVKEIEGFTYKHAEVNGAIAEETAILADGSLVINLYYTRNSYTVTLEKDGGISSVSGAGTYKYGATVKVDAVVSLGYAWNCWSGTLDSVEKVYEFTMPAENVTMKANTSSVVYKISLDNQSADSTGTEKYYEKYNVDNYADASCSTRIEIISLPKKNGYIFGGYFTETDGKGTQYITDNGSILSTSTTFTEDTTLYAYWTPITYIIRFEGNGSDGGSMSDMSCEYNQEYNLAANQFSKDLYNFIGWNTAVDGSGTSYTDQELVMNLSDIHNHVITLYAQWKPNTYEVYFDANGGDGTMDSISLFYDMEQALPENLFTKSNEYGPSTFLGWNTDATATAALFEDEAYVMNIAGCENGYVTLYAIWDDCPWIIAGDLYYSLYGAQNGLITYDELMSHAIASDKEDGAELLPGVDEEKGTSFTILDYLPTDFTQFTASGSVTETYEVTDSAGNTFKKMITVHVVDTTAEEVLPEGTTRFIDEKYYNAAYENGGLEDDSIWKTDPEFVAVIQKAFENSRNDTPIMSFSFTYEEVLKMKEFIRINGIGNTKSDDALQRFYDEFLAPNMVN